MDNAWLQNVLEPHTGGVTWLRAGSSEAVKAFAGGRDLSKTFESDSSHIPVQCSQAASA